MFLELLEQFQIPKDLFPLVELQLTKIFHHYDADNVNNEKQLQKKLATVQNQVKQLN